MELNPVRGMKDYLPDEMRRRNKIIGTLKEVFEEFGFEEAQTPAVERLEILQGKYGEEEKLIWKFQDLGGRWMALRYDKTVPLARIVSKYRPRLPFRRYDIGRSWRYERPQKGRLREFVQADVDIVGAPEGLADADIIALASESMRRLGMPYRIRLNDRRILEAMAGKAGIADRKSAFMSLDKLDKIGRGGVLKDMEERGIPAEKAEKFLETVETWDNPGRLGRIVELAEELGAKNIEFDYSLARGLDYYTGMILEVEVSKELGSVAGGGRYDDMIGMFGYPAKAVGLAFGVERLAELWEGEAPRDQVLVCSIASDKYTANAVKSLRRKWKVSWIKGKKLGKLLSYAEKEGYRKVAIIGPDEEKAMEIRLKDMETGKEEVIQAD